MDPKARLLFTACHSSQSQAVRSPSRVVHKGADSGYCGELGILVELLLALTGAIDVPGRLFL